MRRQKSFKMVKNATKNSKKELDKNAFTIQTSAHLPNKHYKKPAQTGTPYLCLLLHLKTLTEVLTLLKLQVVTGYTIIFTDFFFILLLFHMATQPPWHRSGPAKGSICYGGLLSSHKFPLHCSHFISLLNRALYAI